MRVGPARSNLSQRHKETFKLRIAFLWNQVDAMNLSHVATAFQQVAAFQFQPGRAGDHPFVGTNFT